MKTAKPSPIFGRVRALVKAIPRGPVATYGQLSQLIEKPDAGGDRVGAGGVWG